MVSFLFIQVNVIQPKGVAFVRYCSLSSAEFAKEAMYAQALEGSEVFIYFIV
jgi:hypothetical protein